MTTPDIILAIIAVGGIGIFIYEKINNWIIFREEIACVAIKYADIGVLALPAPARHHHVIWSRLFVDGKKTTGEDTQGFLTTRGRFVDRAQALKIARKRDQIVEKYGLSGKLYSEDMWETPQEAWGYIISHVND